MNLNNSVGEESASTAINPKIVLLQGVQAYLEDAVANLSLKLVYDQSDPEEFDDQLLTLGRFYYYLAVINEHIELIKNILIVIAINPDPYLELSTYFLLDTPEGLEKNLRIWSDEIIAEYPSYFDSFIGQEIWLYNSATRRMKISKLKYAKTYPCLIARALAKNFVTEFQVLKELVERKGSIAEILALIKN